MTVMVKDAVTGDEVPLTGRSGGIDTYQQGGTLDYGTWPQFQGLDISQSLPSAGVYLLAQGVQGYHWGEFILTLGVGSTLLIEARYADGSTKAVMYAENSAGTRVLLDATQLVPANNGKYTLKRFDAADIVGTKTGTNADTLIGRLASA
jgi:hypothetical protein